MNQLKFFVSLQFAISALFLFLTTSSAYAQGGIEVGVLTCESLPGARMNIIIHSRTPVECIFTHSAGEERYNGEIGMGLGIDLNVKGKERSVFTVFSISSDIDPEAYALEGTYIGGKASAALGVGVGASVLVGGSEKNFSLQPIGLETHTGVGAALGIGYLSLY